MGWLDESHFKHMIYLSNPTLILEPIVDLAWFSFCQKNLGFWITFLKYLIEIARDGFRSFQGGVRASHKIAEIMAENLCCPLKKKGAKLSAPGLDEFLCALNSKTLNIFPFSFLCLWINGKKMLKLTLISCYSPPRYKTLTYQILPFKAD